MFIDPCSTGTPAHTHILLIKFHAYVLHHSGLTTPRSWQALYVVTCPARNITINPIGPHHWALSIPIMDCFSTNNIFSFFFFMLLCFMGCLRDNFISSHFVSTRHTSHGTNWCHHMPTVSPLSEHMGSRDELKPSIIACEGTQSSLD
jgi:hypothetical protein